MNEFRKLMEAIELAQEGAMMEEDAIEHAIRDITEAYKSVENAEWHLRNYNVETNTDIGTLMSVLQNLVEELKSKL